MVTKWARPTGSELLHYLKLLFEASCLIIKIVPTFLGDYEDK